MNDICVIIPMFGKEEYTDKCIDETVKHAGIQIDIVVVDDGSQKFYRNSKYNVSVIRLTENTGFTNAINAGILHAQKLGYDYVHLLNNDTEPRKDFIKVLFEDMDKDPNLAIASSARLYPKGDSFLVELYGIDLLRGYQCVIDIENVKGAIVECNWVPVCSALIRMDVIREIGLLDKHMRTHSSDLDYCLRIKMAGYRIVVDPSSLVFHHHEVTTKANGITPEHDQRVLHVKLAGMGYAQFMNKIPLDSDAKTYGEIKFAVVQR